MAIDFREELLEQETIKKILRDLEYNSSENRFSEIFPNKAIEYLSEILLKSRLLIALKKLNKLKFRVNKLLNVKIDNLKIILYEIN